MKVEIIEMTPALAASLIEHNTMNRLLSPPRVNWLADCIDRGAWKADGSAIKVDRDGVLIDGQHRLHAILKTGKSVQCLLITDMDPETRLTVDSGRPRHFGDFLRMNGIANSTDVAATTKIVWRNETGLLCDPSHRAATDTTILWDFYLGKRDLISESIARAKAIDLHVRYIQRSVLALGWSIFSQLDEEDADRFFAQIRGDEKSGTVVNLLCNFGATRPVSAGHYPQRNLAAVVIKAWNLWRKGQEVESLHWKPTKEKFPVAV